MTDFSRSSKPWDGFACGLYLAGVECAGDARAPDGWSRRVAPGFEYIRVERAGTGTFPEALQCLQDNVPLAGAVHDFTCPGTGRSCMYFPARRLQAACPARDIRLTGPAG